MRRKVIESLLVLIAVTLSLSTAAQTGSLIEFDNARVHFVSEAPLELIEAASEKLKGIIDMQKGSFAFTIPVNSFQGFNSALQKEHFHENYMETDKFPKATFAGRIIEGVDLTKNGVHQIRAKGMLVIHGVEQERIIHAKVTVRDGSISVESEFSVMLQDHNIAIPKVVKHKIAEKIDVSIIAKASSKN